MEDAGVTPGRTRVLDHVGARRPVEEELRRRVRQAAFAADVGRALAQGDGLPDTLQRCAAAVVAHLDAAFARVWLLAADGQTLELVASAGLYTHLDGPHGRVPVGALKIGRIAAERRPHLTNDVPHDPHVGDHGWAAREGMVAFAGYPLLVDERLVGVMALFARRPLPPDTLATLASVADVLATGIERKRAEARLREEREALEAINRVGRLLVAELDLGKLVQAVTDAATALTGARFGAFFYNTVDERGEHYTLYSLAGAPKEAFARFPLPRNTAIFGPTFRGEAVVRLADVRQDPRYGQNPPYHGTPPGHLPVVSYLAVPVVARSGEVLGGLFFGHPAPGAFGERAERLAVGLAAQAAVAIENARLYQQAQSAIRLRDEFLASVSHDLKTPLAAVKGQAQLLRRRLERRGAADAARLLAGVASIDGAAARMAALIDELLDVARLRAGQPLELRREAVDLVALAGEAVAEIRRTAARHAIGVEAEAPALVGRWDGPRLRRVLDNLLGNAVKYSPAGGAVEVRVTREQDGAGEWAVLAVRDRGVGIPAADLPHVFERFRRGANVAGIAGAGIGLAGARQIVEQHGGTIAAESREGDGATFTVRLPLAPPDAG